MSLNRRGSVVRGLFYPYGHEECAEKIDYCAVSDIDVKDVVFRAGIVPHAGWDYSGPTAGKVFASIKKHVNPKTFILFGASHGYFGPPALMAEGFWETPFGDIEIDSALSSRLLEQVDGLKENASAHDGEHSIEVQVPFIKRLFPEARIAPILVPAHENAFALGAAVADVARNDDSVVAIGSADLSHYGPRFGFAPKGTGRQALEWVRNVNDKRVIELAVGMNAEAIVSEARDRHNTCGAGAISALVAFAEKIGARRGVLLEYTTSHDVRPFGEPVDFVGYAGIIY